MKNSPSQREWSYQRHAEHESDVAASGNMPTCYTDPGTVDNWRHNRMREGLASLIADDPQAKWITIGDGNYGSDAYYLLNKGADALATSLTDTTLVAAGSKGFLGHYRAENAEALSADDHSFDYALCKEAYHHFPRPAIAFYEMVRIAAKGVVLIEPTQGSGRFLNRLKTKIKTWIRGDKTSEFEVSGNFIFRLSVSETEKMMTAMNGSVVAHKYFNDFYHPSYVGSDATKSSKGLRMTKLGILLQNVFCRLRLLDWGLVTVIAFTSPPGEKLRQKLLEAGFTVKDLPKNPYL